jgi:hypothetical protein
MKNVKRASLAAVCGSAVLLGGCLDGFNWRQLVLYSAVQQGWEYLLDNDASPFGFDLFPDDGDLDPNT